MNLSVFRRDLFRFAPLGLPFLRSARSSAAEVPALSAPLLSTFPMQPSELVREMVIVAHGNVKRVRELVDARPTLANAAWDWGFGDWETALGAASHVGNREIAEYLIGHGARPTLFSATMLGHLEVVKAFVMAEPGVQKIAGPHSISLLSHAKAGGVASEQVLRYLETLGDAGGPTPVPLTEADARLLTGTYVFGPGNADRIEIAYAKGLTFKRTGTDARGLVYLGDHQGEHAFHPAGAAAVRIRFASDGKRIKLTVHDPDVVLTAFAG